MPRLQVYLPNDLYDSLKKSHLPASELLQDAVRRELRRRELQAESERYTSELAAEVGQPSPRERANSSRLAKRIAARERKEA